MQREASRSSLCPAGGLSKKVRRTTGSRSCPAGAKGQIRISEKYIAFNQALGPALASDLHSDSTHNY